LALVISLFVYECWRIVEHLRDGGLFRRRRRRRGEGHRGEEVAVLGDDVFIPALRQLVALA